ncbi:MAG: DUF3306 domain-containing protein [Proteobacteria bacterium]|nr:DUF3306 domain-containing protein [Pseudomonadota bacterium]
MSREGDGFLKRWSQRKTEAREAPPEPEAASAESSDVASQPEVDLDLLPSLDDLNEATDITGFLQKGVPETLRNAALRKMWETNVAIRDYIGPADYQWDFNAASPFVGYGGMTPGTDIAGLVREVAEYHLKPAPDAEMTADNADGALPGGVPAALPDTAPDVAVETGPGDGGEDDPTVNLPVRRRHGGATPR